MELHFQIQNSSSILQVSIKEFVAFYDVNSLNTRFEKQFLDINK